MKPCRKLSWIQEPGVVTQQNRLEIAIHDPQLSFKTADRCQYPRHDTVFRNARALPATRTAAMTRSAATGCQRSVKVAPRMTMPREMAMKWVAGRICDSQRKGSGSEERGKM